MKTLILFGALVLLGWTTLAAGVIAVFEGEPTVSMKTYKPQKPEVLEQNDETGPLLSDCPRGGSSGLDASVPCSAALRRVAYEELNRTDA
ncbi:MAG: hypothetical protein JNM17_09540 [Archangium sp.]|nr:hypothetical protein [Archangium sp.]